MNISFEGVDLYYGDCLEVMKSLPKVDAVIADIPYGTTRARWDTVIPLDKMWEAINRLTGDKTPVVLFGTEPFSSSLRVSNIKHFKYDFIWDKMKGMGFLNAKIQPLRKHEIISVFGKKTPNYYPQKTTGNKRRRSFRGNHLQTDVYGEMKQDYQYDSTERYPVSIIQFKVDTQNSSLHPTQKPLALMEYLVKTFTNEGETVLDFTMGSGTTGLACKKTGRRFIGIENDINYFNIAADRIKGHDVI